MRVYFSQYNERMAYHSLGSDTVCAIDPDVFGHDLAMLRKIKVFLQLNGTKLATEQV
jgi:hypothetical protein